jgi:uncharacterized protein YdcH (DUF465 family)
MFEGQPQAELDALFQANPEFRQLYHRHKELDKKVLDAELGVLPIDDVTLSQMKREKLAAKDRLTLMYDNLHHCRGTQPFFPRHDPLVAGGGGHPRRPSPSAVMRTPQSPHIPCAGFSMKAGMRCDNPMPDCPRPSPACRSTPPASN